MKRKTLHENSFRVFSWFFTSSLGSNLPPPVVGSGITISWHRAAGQNLSSYIIMLLGWFITSFVTLTLITLLYWVLLPFSHTYINQPLFLGGHNRRPFPQAASWHMVFCSDICKHPRSSDTSPMTCWSASQSAPPEHTHGTRTHFWHFQQLFKRKKHPG